MMKLLLTLTLLSSLELHAWGCFPNRSTTTKEQSHAPSHQKAHATLFDTLSLAAPRTFAAYSPKKTFVAALNYGDDTLSVYTTKPYLLTQWIALGNKPTSAAYSPDEKCIAIACCGSTPEESSVTLSYINRKDGKMQRFQLLEPVQNPEVSNPISIAYSPNASFAAVSYYGTDAHGAQSQIALYKVLKLSGKWKTAHVLATPGAGSSYMAFSPNSKFLAVTNFAANSLSVYTVGTELTLTADAPYATGSAPLGLAFSHNGQFLMVCNSGDKSITSYIVDPSGSLVKSSVQGVSGAPGYVTFSQDDLTLSVTILHDGHTKLYDVDPTTGALTFKKSNSTVDSILHPFDE